MNNFAEIGAILKLDDQASAALERVKGGFDRVRDKVRDVQHDVAGFAKQVAATAIGFNLFNGVESIKEFGSEVLNAANEERSQQKALAGTLLLTDRLGKSMFSLKEDAGEIADEFERFGIQFGVSKDAMLEAFSAVAERSNHTTDQVKEFTKDMVFAGKAISGGLPEIANGMSMIELGNIRASNSIVKLITAQHMLKGNAKDVAKQMQQMTPTKRLELAEAAVTSMANKLRSGGSGDLSFNAVLSSMKQIREQLFETVGMPLVDHLTKQLNRLRQYFLDNQATIEHWAHVLGDKVGEWVDIAAEKIREGFQYLQNHAQEIKDAIVSAWSAAKEIVEWILSHKEELAIIYGAKLAVGPGKDLLNLAGAIAGPGAGIAANTAALGVLTAAIVAWAAAFDQAHKLAKENELNTLHVIEVMATSFNPIVAAMRLRKEGEVSQNANAKRRALDQMADSTSAAHDVGDFNRIRSGYIELAKLRGDDSAALETYISSLDQHYYAMRNAVLEIDTASQETNIDQWARVYSDAVKQHNEGVMQYAAGIIAGDMRLQTAMMMAGTNIEGGFGKLAELVGNKSEDFARILRGMEKETTKQKPMNLNFNGGQTFNIKQDFRDQDPDRVAFVMQRDIIKSAENRRQSRLGTAFGL